MNGGGLERRLRLSLWLWSLGLQGSWNPQRMQNLGLLAVLGAWRRRRSVDLEADRHFCRRYYEFFNTNPYMANFLIGGILNLEEQALRDDVRSPASARTFRDTLGRALASIGDQLFWMGLRPALALAACLAALLGWWPAALALIGLFACGQLLLRWISLDLGWRLGMDLVDVVASPRWHRLVGAVRKSGMMLCGVVCGLYLIRLQSVAREMDASMLILGAMLGMGLPLVLRRRLPGEFLLLAACLMAMALTFAIPPSGG